MSDVQGTFILATVGTSLLSHLRRELNVATHPSKQQALALLRKLDPTHVAAGAEINSVEHLLNGPRLSLGETAPPFSLGFLVSETDEGGWTGALLEAYYRSVRGIEDVTWHVVEGLTPDDPERFARTGLRNLVRLSSKLLHEADKKGSFRVINATGGFKAQISFAGLIGQTLGVPVVYQFESFPVCVELPPMPVDFDREIWLTHYDLFMKLSIESCLTDADFPFQAVEPVIRDLLDTYEERGQRLYALSPILELMHQGFLLRRPKNVCEPPVSGKTLADKLALVKAELPHCPNGTEQFAKSLAAKFDWIKAIKNHTPKNPSPRSHLLKREADPSMQWISYSDGQYGVRISVHTTCEHEGHVEYVRQELAQFLLDH